MAEIVAEQVVAAPATGLARYVRRYVGYRYAGLPAGRHLGLPTRDLTIVLAFDAPTRMVAPEPSELYALAGGLITRAVVIEHDGAMEGMQLDLTPAGARALLGVPAAELTHAVVALDALLGPGATELLERLALERSWPARFAALDRALLRRARDDRPWRVPAAVGRAWDLIAAADGDARVADVADAVGYSRRRLNALFAREYGLAPKQLARVVRFERSTRLLKAEPAQRLADLAAAAGYFDQAHMAREWNALAGCPPSAWLAGEDIPFVQDAEAADARASAA